MTRMWILMGWKVLEWRRQRRKPSLGGSRIRVLWSYGLERKMSASKSTQKCTGKHERIHDDYEGSSRY